MLHGFTMEKSRTVFHRKSGKRINKSNAKNSPIAVSFPSSSSPSTYKSPLNWSLRGITLKKRMEIQRTPNNSALPTENKRSDRNDSSDSANSSKNSALSTNNEHDDGNDSSDSANSSKMDHNLSLEDLSISVSNLPDHDLTGNSSPVKNTASKDLTELISNIFSRPVKIRENDKLSNYTGDALDDTLCVVEQGKKKREHSPDRPTNLTDAVMLGSGVIQARKKQKTCTESVADPGRRFVSVPSESLMPFTSKIIMTSQGEPTQNRGSLVKSITNDVVYFQDRQKYAHNFAITIENTETSSSLDRHGSVLDQSSNGGLVEKNKDSGADGNLNSNAPEKHNSLCENKSSSSKLTSEERKIFDRTIDLTEVDERPENAASTESEKSTSNHQVSSKLNAEERKIFDRTIDLSEVDDNSDVIVLAEPIASPSKKQKVSLTERKTLETTIDLSEDDSVVVCDDSDFSDITIVKEKVDCKRVFEFCALKPESDVVYIGPRPKSMSKKRRFKKRKQALQEAHELALAEAAKIYALLGHPVAGDPPASSEKPSAASAQPSPASAQPSSSSAQPSSAKPSSASAQPSSASAQLLSASAQSLLASAQWALRVNLPVKPQPAKPQPASQSLKKRWDQQPRHKPAAQLPSRWDQPMRCAPGGPWTAETSGGPFGPSSAPMWNQPGPSSAPMWMQQAQGPSECWSSPGGSAFGNNVYNPSTAPRQSTGLRPIIIDGSNVAMSHGNRQFSSKGLEICVNYFVKKGHKVYAFVPLFRRAAHDTLDSHILDKLERQKTLIFTPSRNVDGRTEVPYDDRYIVQCAAEKGGVIVSKDNYRDLLVENPMYADTIKNRLLMFTWVEDMLMFPQDPMGRRGPSLDEMLRF